MTEFELFPGENPVKAAIAAAVSPDAPSDSDLAKYELNDLGNARRLLARFGNDIAYTDERGWLSWDGKCWSDKDGHAFALKCAHKTADALWREVENVVGDRKKAFRKFATRTGNSGPCNAMLTQAAAYCRRTSDDFDADPYALNVANGTLRLDGDVRLQPHNRHDRITRICDVRYNPDAECPNWEQFIKDIQPEPYMQEFLQRWLGYSLSGSILEQKIAIFQGGGSNGKSSVLDVAARIMGTYSGTAPIETWLYNDRKSGSGPSPDLARLVGVRLVRTSEPEAGVRLSELVIKQWTGGEPLPTRKLNRDFFDLRPVGKLTMSLNPKPSIVGKDFGIRRRILMVPFRQTFPIEPGRNLVADLLTEREGIFNWLLEGWQLYQKNGLRIPATVAAATDAYFAENDPIGQFVIEACETRNAAAAGGIEFYEAGAELYAAYKRWCDEANEEPKKQTPFGRRLSDLGFPAERRGDTRKKVRIGLKIKMEYWPRNQDEAA